MKTVLFLLLLMPIVAVGKVEDPHAEWNRFETELIEMGFEEKELANIGLDGLRILHERVKICNELKQLGVSIKWYEKPLEEMRQKLKVEREKADKRKRYNPSAIV